MTPIYDCTAVILAGGRSLRMGRDKADVMLAGISMLDRCVMAMQKQFKHLALSVRTPREYINIHQVCDQEGDDRAPMAGIVSVLEQVDTPWVFAIACDMPLINPCIIDYMASCRGHQHAVAAVVGGIVQPLSAFYSKAILPEMRLRMNRGDRSLMTLIGDLDVTLVEEKQLKAIDPDMHGFMDLDTEQDVDMAEAILGASR